jgi:hypothetical protein
MLIKKYIGKLIQMEICFMKFYIEIILIFFSFFFVVCLIIGMINPICGSMVR